MRLLNLIQCTNLGGMEQASLGLMLQFKDHGHASEVISVHPVGDLGSILAEHGIPVTGLQYRGKGGWRSYLLLKRMLHDADADALVVTGSHLLSMIAMGGLFKGRRILAVHFHHAGVKPIWYWRLFYALAFKRFNAITFPSDFVRREAESIYPPIKRLSYTVRNPIAVPPVTGMQNRVDARKALGIPENAMVVGNAGWLIKRKRFDIFMRVAQKVLTHMPDALFLIAGDGEERSTLEHLAAELNISRSVRWLGWQKDMTCFFQCLDVMLFNSDWDAMGLSALEAVSHGVPLVASVLHGGLNEIITNDAYGFLLGEHDIERLAVNVVFLLKNPEAARSIALAGRCRIRALSSPKEIFEQVHSLLTQKN